MRDGIKPTCPDCEEGRQTYQWRSVSPQDVSPCDSEAERTCERCNGSGVLDEIACSECADWFAIPEDDEFPHYCKPGEAEPNYLCHECRIVENGDSLHLAKCDGIRLSEAAEAACEGDR